MLDPFQHHPGARRLDLSDDVFGIQIDQRRLRWILTDIGLAGTVFDAVARQRFDQLQDRRQAQARITHKAMANTERLVGKQRFKRGIVGG